MRKVCLGDVATERRETCKGGKGGYPIVGLEHLTPGEITLSMWDDAASETTFTKVFRKGDVLFGRRRAYLKKAAIAPFDGICSGDITVIAAKPDRILSELLPFVIQNDELFSFAVEGSAGSLSPRVKWEHLKNYELVLPDLGTQKRLADLLWSIDTTKKSYQRLIAATDELVKSQFLGEIQDKGYPSVELIDLIKKGAGLSYGIVQPGDDGTGDMGVLRPVDLVNGGISTRNIKYIDSKIGEAYQRTMLTGEEILITVRGTTGITAISDARFAGMNVTRGIAVIRYDGGKILPAYLNAYLKSEVGQRYIQEHTKGIALKQINIADLKVMPIIVPPLPRQEQFATFVRQSDKSKFELEQALKELTATYKRILAENLG